MQGTFKLTKREGFFGLGVVIMVLLIIVSTKIIKIVFGITGDSAFSFAIDLVETVGLIATILIAVQQMIGSKEIAKATFIVELNKAFVENEQYLEMYNALQNCIDGNCICKKKCKNFEKLSKTDRCNLDKIISKAMISNYLTFFETINMLRLRGVVEISLLNDLFAYRFFAAVHSKFIQQEKIAPQPENFRNIFQLEHEWMSWRKANGKSMNGVYGRLPLRDLVKSDDEYNKILYG